MATAETVQDCPYESLIGLMVTDLKQKLNKKVIPASDTELKELLKCANTVLQFISSLDELQYVSPSGGTYGSSLTSLIKDVCFPLLYSLHLLPESDKTNSEKGKALTLLARLVLTCCHYLEEHSVLHVVTQLVIPLCTASRFDKHFLQIVKDDDFHKCMTEPLSQFFSLELFGIVLNNQQVFSQYLAKVHQLKVERIDLLSYLFHLVLNSTDTTWSFCKAFTVVSKLLSYFPKSLQKQCVSQIWQQYSQPLKASNGNTESVRKSLFVYYCLKTYLFPLDVSEKEDFCNRVCCNNFWSVVQAGLMSPDPSDRKLAMYLLKRLVDTSEKNSCSVNAVGSLQAPVAGSDVSYPLFWWSPQSAKMLSALWENFILLIETLEEKQVHIIKPLLSRMQKLIDASSAVEDGHPSFHSSWLIVIVTRCFHHDSHFMSRWGALTILTLDFSKVPLIQHGQLRFLSHDLLVHLQENKLYSRYEGTELGKSSPVGEALKVFFANLFSTLSKENRMEYLHNLLQIVCENSWGSIPLTFVFEGLSHIPPTPVIGPELMQLLRQVLQSCLTTHEVYMKGAIQCFISQMFMNLLDLETVGFRDISLTIASLNRDESVRRGTTLWENLTDWLTFPDGVWKWDEKEVLAAASDFLRGNLGDENSATIVDGYKVISVARMLILYADVLEKNIEMKEEKPKALLNSPLGRTLAEISETLTDIRSRAYVNIGRVDRCLSLLFSLTKEAGNLQKNQVDILLKRNFALHFTDVSHFIKNRLAQDLTKASDLDEIKFYTDVLLSLGIHSDQCFADLKELVVFVSKALNMAAGAKADDEKLAEYDVLSTAAMKVLNVVFSIMVSREEEGDNTRSAGIVQAVCETVKIREVPLPFSRRSSSKDSISKAQVGRVISRFISSKWQCQKRMFQFWLLKKNDDKGVMSTVDLQKIVDDAMEDMAIGSGNSDIAIFQALEIIIEEIVKKVDPSVIPNLVELGWCKVMEEKKNALFWRKLEALIPMVLHKTLLEQDKDSVVGVCLDQFLDKLYVLGNDKSGVMYLVFDHFCNGVLQKDTDRTLAARLIPLLVDGCYIGSVHKRGERVWLDVCAYIESLGSSCAVNQILSSVSKNDLYTRVIILNWLSRLQPEVPADYNFVQSFVKLLRSKYMSLANQSTHRQFTNSFSHRQKHRMVLVLLLLVDYVKEAASAEYLSVLWHALELECHPSVRQSLEWLVMILICRYPSSASSIWDVFKLYDSKRSVCLCSLFLIVSHVGPKLPQNMQDSYFSQALTSVLPWTMAHHYNTRIFAQAAVFRLWEQCTSLQLVKVTTQFAVVQSSIDFLLKNSNASGTVSKLLDIYIFSTFDPVEDFSVETIFHTLPRLACIADDEWIQPRQFVQMDPSWELDSQHLVSVRNLTQKLAQCKEGAWKMKAPHESDEDHTESTDGDVQKKVMPWRQMSPDQETEAELTSQRQRRSEDGLILVTSLIDKVPNLGGLCRTSEIFGVSEFVISSLTHLEDRMFQSLSVSAQKWIKITEVLQPRLIEFLEEKRMQGYTLVGVEQTANSVCLQDYQFPKKTLLLLGNEKEGIPVDIIQSLDVCVEIPQLGVIRSLNVHVCGALIVWEYTRQHMGEMNSPRTNTK